MFYLYIIYSERADKYYVGHTNNVERRVEEHNSNPRMTFTHKFRPWFLMASFAISENRGDAVKVEKYIKRQKSRRLIERLIDIDFIPIGNLRSLVRVLP